MRRPLILTTAVALLLVAGCGDTHAPTSIPRAPALVQGTAATLDDEIGQLIIDMFPGGLETATGTRWENVKRKLDEGATATARSMHRELVDFIAKKEGSVTPPSGYTSAREATTRLVLLMSLYVYGGSGAPVPGPITGDATYGIVMPGETRSFVTPSEDAGVAGLEVAQPTVFIVAQHVGSYARCEGPLDTELCQFPHYYSFKAFPHEPFVRPARFGVCHVTTGDRAPTADQHRRLRLAHDKPANPAHYTPGSTIVDGIEILREVSVADFLRCEAEETASLGPRPEGSVSVALWYGQRALRGLTRSVGRLVTPRLAHAYDQGGGGESHFTSNFVNVATQPDLAFAGSYSAPSSAQAGDDIQVTGVRVTNLSNLPSDSFHVRFLLSSDQVISADDAVLGNPLVYPGPLAPDDTAEQSAMLPLPEDRSGNLYLLAVILPPASGDLNSSNNEATPHAITVAPINGSITGRVLDAHSLAPIAGAQASTGSRSATSDADGYFTITEVPAGTVDVQVSAPDYVSATRTGVAVVAGATTSLGEVHLSPVAAATELRVVLDWGETPRDLDSHLTGPTATGGRFHVYFGHPSYSDALSEAMLDVDDVNGFGPETITLTRQGVGDYLYYVHNWSGEAPLAGSNARVRVYRGGTLLHTFTAPLAGTGRYWKVFGLSGTTFTVYNQIGDDPLSSASAAIASAIAPVDAAAAAVAGDLSRVMQDVAGASKSVVRRLGVTKQRRPRERP